MGKSTVLGRVMGLLWAWGGWRERHHAVSRKVGTRSLYTLEIAGCGCATISDMENMADSDAASKA